MTTSPEEQKLQAQAGQVRERLDGLAADLQVVDDEFENLAPQRTHHDLLGQVCGSLDQLEELGAASLFWGEKIAPARIEETLREVRDRVSVFQEQLDELEQRRQVILDGIRRDEENLEILGADIFDIREEEERRKREWVVERDIGPLPTRRQLMAWARGGEDDRRFRKALGIAMLVSLVFGAALPLIDLPVPKRFMPDEMPKRLAQLVRKVQAKPATPPPKVADAPSEQETPEPKEPDTPEPQEQPVPDPDMPVVAEANPSDRPGPPGPEGPAVAPAPPRKQVGKAGILAFRDKFASLAKDDVAPRLGSDARYGDADDVSRDSSRSMLTSNAPGSSRGIDLASLSRNTGGRGRGGGGGGGGGGGIQGVQVGRASSAIAAIGGGGGGGRPMASDGPGASRTDEEIQIVFDRYKASFYRLYNRELRNDPTLRGQMVLQLTIEPDGSVSMCVLQSSDMDAPVLADQVVNRVKTINFGAKDVEALTIVYPIDFLPAA